MKLTRGQLKDGSVEEKYKKEGMSDTGLIYALPAYLCHSLNGKELLCHPILRFWNVVETCR
jgi:hypothetical protein